MCIWQELKKVNNCIGCPLSHEHYISYCGEWEDVQDIIDIIASLKNMLDKLEEE